MRKASLPPKDYNRLIALSNVVSAIAVVSSAVETRPEVFFNVLATVVATGVLVSCCRRKGSAVITRINNTKRKCARERILQHGRPDEISKNNKHKQDK